MYLYEQPRTVTECYNQETHSLSLQSAWPYIVLHRYIHTYRLLIFSTAVIYTYKHLAFDYECESM